MLIVAFIVIVLAITENGVAIYRKNNGAETLQIFFPYVKKKPRLFVVLVFLNCVFVIGFSSRWDRLEYTITILSSSSAMLIVNFTGMSAHSPITQL